VTFRLSAARVSDPGLSQAFTEGAGDSRDLDFTIWVRQDNEWVRTFQVHTVATLLDCIRAVVIHDPTAEFWVTTDVADQRRAREKDLDRAVEDWDTHMDDDQDVIEAEVVDDER